MSVRHQLNRDGKSVINAVLRDFALERGLTVAAYSIHPDTGEVHLCRIHPFRRPAPLLEAMEGKDG